MALRPIKLHLDGEELHLVAERELSQWGGFLNGRRGAFRLVTPDNVPDIRRALMVPKHVDTEGVFTELRKQLEDGSALFFEVPPPPVTWDAPPVIDIHELVPTGGDPRTHAPDRPGPEPGVHWIEIVCISADGGSYAGAKARLRFPDGRSEYATLDGASSVRFDDLSEGGTVHFELSGDAVAKGNATVPTATRYELGAPLGLVTRRRHVLIVHPNPNAFVSAVLVVDDEPVVGGQYTLTSAGGDQTAELSGDPARAEGFALPSEATYAFEGVILPPRPSDNGGGDNGGGDNGGGDNGGGDNGGGGGTDPVTPGPLGPGGVEPDHVVLVLQRDDNDEPLAGARVRLVAGDEERFAETDARGRVTFPDLPTGTAEVEAYVILDPLPPTNDPPEVLPVGDAEPPWSQAEDDDDFEDGDPDGEPAEPYSSEEPEDDDE